MLSSSTHHDDNPLLNHNNENSSLIQPSASSSSSSHLYSSLYSDLQQPSSFETLDDEQQQQSLLQNETTQYDELEQQLNEMEDNDGDKTKHGHHHHNPSMFKKALRLNKIIILFIVLVLSIVAYAIMDETEHDSTKYYAISGKSVTSVALESKTLHFIQFKALALELPPLNQQQQQQQLLELTVIYRVKPHDAVNKTTTTTTTTTTSHMTYMTHMTHMNKNDYNDYNDNNDTDDGAWIQISNKTFTMQNIHQDNETVLVQHLFETPKPYLITTNSNNKNNEYQFQLYSNNQQHATAMQVTITHHSRLFSSRVILALLVLLFVYALIIFELVHRTVATILGAFMSISALSIMNLKPSVHTMINWVEFHTLFLLFGMMVIVAIMSQTGFFEYLALKAYRLSKGRLWRLVFILSIIVAVTSSMLDNVTSMLLLTPVIIRLCKVMDISPVPTLIATVVVSNIGGCATAVGDPPVTLIVNTPAIREAGIGFNEILFFMAPGTIIMIFVALFFIRFIYWKEFSGNGKRGSGTSDAGTSDDGSGGVLAPHVSQLKNEIEIWSQTAARLSKHVNEERSLKQKLNNHVKQLQNELREQENSGQSTTVDISQLESEYVIRNKPKFVMCFAVMFFVVLMFFLETFISKWVHLSLDSIAIVGALLVIVLTDTVDFDHILEKVEWSSLLFFATLFIMMGSLDELGLIGFVGDMVTNLILKVNEQWRLPFAITVIIWLSAILSAIIDSIPYTTAMIPVIIAMRDTLDLPLKPLVFSLAYGSGLGGNGSIFASTANLVVAGISEKFGHPISFMAFARCGVPIMFLCTVMANAYLLLVHCVFKLGLS